MKTAVCRIDLGVTRIAGYTLYDETTREFQETTPKEVKALILADQVNGLKLADGEIALDDEGFNMQNMMIKSAVGKYRMLCPVNNSLVNCTYAVVRMLKTDNGPVYETVSNKCARVKVPPERLKMMMEIGYVAGARLADGDIQLCSGVTVEDRCSTKAVTATPQATNANEMAPDLQPVDNAEKENQDNKEANTMEKLFESLGSEAASDADTADKTPVPATGKKAKK